MVDGAPVPVRELLVNDACETPPETRLVLGLRNAIVRVEKDGRFPRMHSSVKPLLSSQRADYVGSVAVDREVIQRRGIHASCRSLARGKMFSLSPGGKLLTAI